MDDGLLRASELHVRLGGRAVLHDVNLVLSRGELLGVQGRSGSGKTTLLHCLAGLVSPESGRVVLDGKRIDQLNDRQRCRTRLRSFGFVFQFGDLIPELDVGENVGLPLRLLGHHKHAANAAASELLDRLGIGHLTRRQLSEVSGGELQRAAIARAVVHGPQVIFADEPTGALDGDTADEVLELLIEVARAEGTSVVLVTHDQEVAAVCDRIVRVRAGALHDVVRAE
ncbi:MAG: ABC transporter ATP-binding protein [Nocardioidaceae bacterium]|nr:ABC transporter ATP-binding protein [Nocardioidaceae bacterium]